MHHRKLQAEPKILTPAEAGYLAGFIDGEGSLMIISRVRQWKPNTRRYRYFRAVCSVAQRDIDVLAYLKNLVGGGTVIRMSRTAGKYGGWEIKWYPGTLRWLLPQIEPYLVLKKRQANLLLAFMDLTDKWVGGRELTDDEYAIRAEMYNTSKTLNQRPKYKSEMRPVATISTVKSESETIVQ